MSLGDALKAVRDALKGNPNLLKPFVAGESLTIQRNVNGRNVLMVIRVEDPSSLNPHKMMLHATLQLIGESPHADGRVARQLDTINRLVAHLQNHCTDTDCPHLNQAGDVAAPETLINPDGSGYQP